MKLFNKVSAGNTQAGGAVKVALGVADLFCHHQVQVEVEGLPTSPPPAGTLDIAIRSPGATEFVSLGTINMTGSELIKTFGPAFVAEMRFTPTGFNGETYNVIITSGQ